MESKLAARVFGALAHAVRLELFRRLMREGEAGLPAGDLAQQTGLPPSTLSFHLHELTASGLLLARRRGRKIHYAVRRETMRELLWFVGEDCCQGRTEMCPSPFSRINAQRAQPSANDRRTVLFLCSHNAARSQIAEALLRQRASDRFEVFSAGMRPRPIHPMTLRVLDEIGVPTEGLIAKDLGDYLGKRPIDHAIVLCPEAQADCPNVEPFAGELDYWPLPDPTQPARSPSEQIKRFRAIRDTLQGRIGTWLLQLQRGSSVRTQPRQNMRIAINGFGRMGRLFARTALQRDFDLVAIHEPNGDAAGLALGLEFDSIHGRFEHAVSARQSDELHVAGRTIAVVPTAATEHLPWAKLGIDLVVDCSGKAKRRSACAYHQQAGAKRVLVSNPVADAPNLVFGVNHHDFDFHGETIVTAASCTTNCLAPVVRVIHDAIGIERGIVTTIHDPTNTQTVVDRVSGDPRRARSALLNLIPTTTNSATAVTLIVPELKGRLDSIAVRAPVLNASLTDCAFHVSRDTTVDEVNRALQAAADHGPLVDVLGFEQRPLVSSDFARDPRSGIVDAGCTRVVDHRLVKVMAWYDNEWGYVNRMADLASCIATGMSAMP